MNIEKDFKNKLNTKDYVYYLLSRNMILLLSPLMIIALLTAIIFSIINEGFTFATIIYFLPIALFILSYIQMYRVIKHTINSHSQISELKISFTENEYKDITNGEKNSLNYDKFYCYKETKNYLYMFVDRNNALIIPKREYENEELNKIKATFTSKIRKAPIYDLSSWLTLAFLITLVGLIIYNLFI